MQSDCSCPCSQLNAMSGFRSDKRNCNEGADGMHESVFSKGVGASMFSRSGGLFSLFVARSRL